MTVLCVNLTHFSCQAADSHLLVSTSTPFDEKKEASIFGMTQKSEVRIEMRT